MSAMTDTARAGQEVDFVNYFSAGTSIVVQRGNPEASPTSRTCAGGRWRSRRGTIQVDLLTRAQTQLRGAPITSGPTPTNSDALVQLRTGRAVAVLNDFAARRPTWSTTRGPGRTTSSPPRRSTSRVCTASPSPRTSAGCATPCRGACERLLRSGAYADVLRALEGRRRGRRPGEHRLRPLRAAERPAREGSRPATGETRGGSKENDTRPSQLVRTTVPPADPSDHGDQRHTPPGGGLNHRRNSFDAPGADG